MSLAGRLTHIFFVTLPCVVLFIAGFGVLAARRLGVRVGAGCRIYSRMFGSEPWLIEIGDSVTVTSGVRFLTHDGSGWLVRDDRGRRYRYGRIVVGNRVFIGVNSIIMPGVRIGDRVIVGAGSVVTKSIPTNSVVAGVPARFIMSFEQFEKSAAEEWAAEQELRGKSFKQRVDSVVSAEFRPELESGDGAD